MMIIRYKKVIVMLMVLAMVSGKVMADVSVVSAPMVKQLGVLISEAVKNYNKLVEIKKASDETRKRISKNINELKIKKDSKKKVFEGFVKYFNLSDKSGSSAVQNQTFIGHQSSGEIPDQFEVENSLRQKLYINKNSNREERNAIQDKRFQLVEHSAMKSLSLSGVNKEKSSEIVKRIEDVSLASVSNESLAEELMSSNELLTMIALQQSQTNEMLAQLLEVIGASMVQGTPQTSYAN